MILLSGTEKDSFRPAQPAVSRILLPFGFFSGEIVLA